MQQLPNNCRAGKFSIFPSNWKTVKANPRLKWRISYWFFDDNLNQKKKVVIKGMNHLQTAFEKKECVEALKASEQDLIERQGYNPITKQYSAQNESEISGFTLFIDALYFAHKQLVATERTKRDIKNTLKYIVMAAENKGYARYAVKEIMPKHIKHILYKLAELMPTIDMPVGKKGQTKKGVWNAGRHNHFRKYISLLFTELIDIEAVDTNPAFFVKKQKAIKRIRDTMSQAQRKQVDLHLHEENYSFWRMMHIFFHSGCRETELMAVRKTDVDLENQRYKIIMKKGKAFTEEWRTIKTIVLPLWQDVCNEASQSDYLFSKGLKPGKQAIRADQLTKRWRRHVKLKLGITADFYSLKHSNLDDIAALAGITTAQAMAGHTTPVITMHYTTGEGQRKHNRLKDIANTL